MNALADMCWERPEARVVMVGPTVGLYPDAFLRRGVDVLGGVRVTAPDAFLDVLAEGGSGYHFFGRSAEKVVLVRNAMARCAQPDPLRSRVRSTPRQPAAGPYRQRRSLLAASAA
jgi:Putative heavy-metal chelation